MPIDGESSRTTTSQGVSGGRANAGGASSTSTSRVGTPQSQSVTVNSKQFATAIGALPPLPPVNETASTFSQESSSALIRSESSQSMFSPKCTNRNKNNSNNDNSSSSIRVCIRFRPLLSGEEAAAQTINISEDAKSVTLTRTTDSTATGRVHKDHVSYDFHHIFNSDAKNDDVHNVVAPPVINTVTNAIVTGTSASAAGGPLSLAQSPRKGQPAVTPATAAILSYGQTGSGKTYTMRSLSRSALSTVFEKCANRTSLNNTRITFQLATIQIYCGEVYNLLKATKKEPKGAKLPEAKIGKPFYFPFVTVSKFEEVEAMLAAAEEAIVTASHKLNNCSSRAHCITLLRMTETEELAGGAFLWGSPRNAAGAAGSGDGRIVSESNLFLVDLAGSEKVRQTEATGLAFTEGIFVNESLTALNSCIQCMSEKRPHIPVRDNILTWILADCFVQSTVYFLCCCSPSANCEEETRYTLSFADIAKEAKISRTLPKPSLSGSPWGGSAGGGAPGAAQFIAEIQRLNEELAAVRAEYQQTLEEERTKWSQELRRCHDRMETAVTNETKERFIREGLERKVRALTTTASGGASPAAMPLDGAPDGISASSREQSARPFTEKDAALLASENVWLRKELEAAQQEIAKLRRGVSCSMQREAGAALPTMSPVAVTSPASVESRSLSTPPPSVPATALNNNTAAEPAAATATRASSLHQSEVIVLRRRVEQLELLVAHYKNQTGDGGGCNEGDNTTNAAVSPSGLSTDSPSSNASVSSQPQQPEVDWRAVWEKITSSILSRTNSSKDNGHQGGDLAASCLATPMACLEVELSGTQICIAREEAAHRSELKAAFASGCARLMQASLSKMETTARNSAELARYRIDRLTKLLQQQQIENALCRGAESGSSFM